MTKNKSIYFILFIILLSLILSFYFGEDTLGGGKMDYNYHTKYFFHFSENFSDAYNKFGLEQESNSVRNSPVFYMLFSIFLKLGFTLKNLKIINILILFPMLFFFVKCLEIKYSNIDIKTKIYFSSALLLSPTIRTMIVWPYPLLWALCFFLISLYFFLVFKKTKSFRHKIKLAYYNVFFLSLGAYFTPNFAFFSIFFLYNFYITFNLQKEIFKIILLNLILAAPAIYFLITKDFYLFNSEVYKIDTSVKYNLSNKIIIISSMLLLFFLPFISKKSFFNCFSKITVNFSLFILLFFIFINTYFYNFLPNAGGGIFYHLSHYLVKNSSILFIVFFFTLYLFRLFNLYNLNNVLLFTILVFYNLQFTIYYKYFDPLMFFIFLFLVKFNNKIDIKIDILSKKYLLFYAIFLAMNFSKSLINY
jgi:hypothetical protein